MQNRIIFFLIMLIMISCDKEDKVCTAPSPGENIIGTWSAAWNSSQSQSCVVQFKKDGSYVEDKDLLLGSYYTPIASWNALGDTINVLVQFDNKSTSNYSFIVKENSCNEIILDMEGLDQVKLTRK